MCIYTWLILSDVTTGIVQEIKMYIVVIVVHTENVNVYVRMYATWYLGMNALNGYDPYEQYYRWRPGSDQRIQQDPVSRYIVVFDSDSDSLHAPLHSTVKQRAHDMSRKAPSGVTSKRLINPCGLRASD